MLKKYHIEICQRALESSVSPKALKIIIAANLKQDQIRYQVRHPHFHFDANAFEASERYIERQRQTVWDALQTKERPVFAWEAFGRLTHTAQDFYAHSNYIQLWLHAHPKADVTPPTQIDALDPEIMQHPDLHSGNIYLWDWLAFVPGFQSLALRLTPQDSHTHMNLDHPGRGPLFPFAFAAAVQRTVFEFEQIVGELSTSEVAVFKDC